MGEGAQISDIEQLRDFAIFLSKTRDAIVQRCDDSRVQVERVTRTLQETAPEYWRSELRKAEQRFSEARDALSLCRAKVRPDDHEACTEQVRQLQRAKRRLDLCQEKNRQLQACVQVWDQFIQQSRGAFGQAIDLGESRLPLAESHLRELIALLDQYTEQA